MEKKKQNKTFTAKKELLKGCKAYPSSGLYPGAPLSWCRKARGEWCGDCKWRSF